MYEPKSAFARDIRDKNTNNMTAGSRASSRHHWIRSLALLLLTKSIKPIPAICSCMFVHDDFSFYIHTYIHFPDQMSRMA